MQDNIHTSWMHFPIHLGNIIATKNQLKCTAPFNLLRATRKPSLFGSASDKIGVFLQRYEFAKHRTIRHDQHENHLSHKSHVEVPCSS